MTASRVGGPLFATQAARLLDDLEETADGPLWTQDLYGQPPAVSRTGSRLRRQHDPADPRLGLADRRAARGIADAVPRTLAANAWRSELGASWRRSSAATGATLALPTLPRRAGHGDDVCRRAVHVARARDIAGRRRPLHLGRRPLAKGSNLCHGTGGNGYAFLKLHRRTKDRGLARAGPGVRDDRDRAMPRGARREFGRGRYSLWTGDIGLAIYLWDCLTASPRFPTIDVLRDAPRSYP